MDADMPATAGPVALVGSGEFTPAMAAVDGLLLEGGPRRVVFLPTAPAGKVRSGSTTGSAWAPATTTNAIERWWPGVVEGRQAELEPGETLVGIDENTVLVGGPHRFEVHGAGAVWVVDAAGRRRYRAGAEIDFSSLVTPSP